MAAQPVGSGVVPRLDVGLHANAPNKRQPKAAMICFFKMISNPIYDLSV
jgi:hypothetical protein